MVLHCADVLAVGAMVGNKLFMYIDCVCYRARYTVLLHAWHFLLIVWAVRLAVCGRFADCFACVHAQVILVCCLRWQLISQVSCCHLVYIMRVCVCAACQFSPAIGALQQTQYVDVQIYKHGLPQWHMETYNKQHLVSVVCMPRVITPWAR